MKNDKNLAHFFLLQTSRAKKLQMNAMNVMWQPVGGFSLFPFDVTRRGKSLEIIGKKEECGKNLKHSPFRRGKVFRLFFYSCTQSKNSIKIFSEKRWGMGKTKKLDLLSNLIGGNIRFPRSRSPALT
jgi:hypothetical protein